MTVEQLAKELDIIIPRELSEPWDNDGRMIITDPKTEVTRALCVLDCTSFAIEIAISWGCNVIITHHPLIFKPIGAITPNDSVGKRIIKCINNGISVLSYHTRLDSMDGGVNDILAGYLGIKNTAAFLPYGRIGEVEEQSFADFAKKTSDALRLDVSSLGLVKASDTVKRVAVVSGCGKDEINAVIAAGADTFVTGEVMHNHMIDCKELGLNLICGTHYATERIIVPILAEMVNKYVPCDIYMFGREEEYGI